MLRTSCNTPDEARSDLDDDIGLVYNNRWRASSNDQLSPLQYEQHHPERVASVYTKGGDSLCRDINYICSASRWVWLAAVLDVYWRSDVHWSLTHRVDGKLSVNAVEVAFERRRRQDEVTFHLDQDSQYAGRIFPRRLWRYRMVQRMVHRGSCLEPAPGVNEYLSDYQVLDSKICE